MFKKIILPAMAVAVAALLTPSEAGAYGGCGADRMIFLNMSLLFKGLVILRLDAFIFTGLDRAAGRRWSPW